MKLRYKGELGFWAEYILYRVSRFLSSEIYPDKTYLNRMFKRFQEYELDWDNLQTFNEKIQWLKLNDFKPIDTILADKYLARNLIKDRYGEELLIPLVFESSNYRDVVPENFPDHPFIIKPNHGWGNYYIVRDKTAADWKKIQTDCRMWLKQNYYYVEREYQYKQIKPRIIGESLLINKEGKIPNDYKLNCFNGKCELVYVCIDREGSSKKNIYDSDWNPLHFTWDFHWKNLEKIRGKEIDKPLHFDRMKAVAEDIAKDYRYIRVDFYDVDDRIYIGEITYHPGGGFARIMPRSYDFKYGALIIIDD
jgi:hypothetical protein